MIMDYSKFISKHENYLYRLNNFYILEDNHLVFVDIPKAAGTSIKHLLLLNSGKSLNNRILSKSNIETSQEMLIHNHENNPLNTLGNLNEVELNDILFNSKWKKFCVVRNPFTRIFSAWFSKILLREPTYINKVEGYQLPKMFNKISEIYLYFENFIENIYNNQFHVRLDPHWDTQYNLLFEDSIKWDRIFKFEKIDQSLPNYFKQLKLKHYKVNKFNISGLSYEHWRVSSKCKKMIYELFEKDFDEYGYDNKLSQFSTSNNVPEEYILFHINSIISKNINFSHSKTFYEHEINNINNELNTIINEMSDELNRIKNSRGWKTIILLRKLRNFS